MRAHHIGHGPGLAAPQAAASGRAAGAASVVADRVAPAELTPQKKSARTAQAAQSRQQIKHLNSATCTGGDKAFRTLRAELAFRGYGLSRTHGDDGPVCFRVNRWGMVRELRDFAAVHAFAAQAGCAMLDPVDQLRAALCGAALSRLADGELLLSRGYAKTCPDLRSVAALPSRMKTGGQR